MTFSQIKNSGSKIVPCSDLRVGTTRKERSVISWRRKATWNVRIILQYGKLKNLKLEMARIKIDILGLSEIRWPKQDMYAVVNTDFCTQVYRKIIQELRGRHKTE